MRSALSSVRGVVFDLWNTLAYSDVDPLPMEMLAGELGILGRAGWRRIIEKGMMTRPYPGIREALTALEEAAAVRLSPAARDAVIRKWNIAAAATRLFADALPALDALRPEFRTALLSNTQSFDIHFIHTSGLASRLDVQCLSCQVGRLKPDPAIFQEAVRMLDLRPEEALMVGDSLSDDVEGALGAGLKAVHLARGSRAAQAPGAAGSLTSLTGLASLLA